MFDNLKWVPYLIAVVWAILALSSVWYNFLTLQRIMVILSGVSVVLLLLLPKVKTARAAFWLVNTFTQWVVPVPMEALNYILNHAKEGDAQSVIRAFDKFCWEECLCMNIGDVKGAIMDKALQGMATPPKVLVELGSHCGYSTIRIASQLKAGQMLHSVDPDALGHAVSAKLITFAAVGDRVKTWYAYSGDVLRKMAEEGMKIDFMLLDHVKELYLSDLQLALSLNLFREGSVIVADNVLVPGAPEYKAWITKQSNFRTEVHSTFLEYSKSIRDEVLVSTFLGNIQK